MKKLIYPLLILVLAGCKQLPDVPTAVSPYRIDIQQGNVVTQDMVDRLKPGMTRSQVRFVLGSPLIVDPFRTDRWDYVYMYQKQGKETERRNIAAIFEDDKLLRLEGDITALPAAAKPAAMPAEKPTAKPPATVAPTPKVPANAASAAKPAPAKTETAKGEGAAPVVPADAAKPAGAKDVPKEEKGFFGRVLDKIGF